MRKPLLCLALFMVAAALYAQDYAFGPVYSNGDRVATISTAGGPFLSVNMQRFTFLVVTPANAAASTANFSGLGDTTTSAGSCGSTAGVKVTGCTTAGTTNAVGWSSNSTDGYKMGTNLFVQSRGALISNTTQRTWFYTMTDQTLATMCAAADPAGNYVGFRFDTGAGDTNWQAVTKDATTQSVSDTGVPPDTAASQSFSIVQSNADSNIKFYINGILVATKATNLPTAATQLKLIHCLRNLSGAEDTIGGVYAFIFNDYTEN